MDKAELFTDGEAYERLMGRWSRLVGEIFLDWLDVPSTERRIIRAKFGGATFGQIVRGNLRRQAAICEKPTQNRSDEFFPVGRILSCPSVADTVVTATIFQQHFPSMLTIECDGEGDLGILCMFNA